MNYFFLTCVICLSLFIAGCSIGVTDDYDFRVEVLYEHTLLMQQYSNASVLNQIGLNMSFFPTDSSFLSVSKKHEILQDAYDLDSASVSELEEEMNLMMDKWSELQDLT